MITDLEPTATCAPRQTTPLHHFLAPVGLARFLAESWGKGHRLVKRGDPHYFRSLFTLEDFDRCLTVAKGHGGAIMSVVGARGSGRNLTEGAVTEEMHGLAYKRFRDGDTVRIVGVDRLSPAVTELCLDLNLGFDARTQANAYLTPPAAQGFTTHFDYRDAFITQVSGTKQWFVYDPDHRLPVDLPYAKVWSPQPQDESALVLRERCVLEAGDVLYIPRGFYHQALTSSEHSLHLTISIEPVYWVTVLQRALERLCIADPDLREGLPPGALSDPEMMPAFEERFRALLGRLAEQASFDDTASSLIDDRLAAVRQPPDGHFADLLAARSLDLDTVVVRRSGIPALVDTHGRTALLQFGTNRVEGPLALVSAFDFVRRHLRFRVRELPDSLTADSKTLLARRLVDEGLLRIERS